MGDGCGFTWGLDNQSYAYVFQEYGFFDYGLHMDLHGFIIVL